MSNLDGKGNMSDAFACGPSSVDIAKLSDAFLAISLVYEAQRIHTSRYLLKIEQVEMEERLTIDTVPAEAGELASHSLGECTRAVFDHYITAARDHEIAGIEGSEYQGIGLTIPVDLAHLETDDEGVEWLSFGEIGPIPLATGALPDNPDTILVQKSFDATDEWDGSYEVRFFGYDIDPFRSEMA
jgi:hypothetical protein